jgi:hypothetical protein
MAEVDPKEVPFVPILLLHSADSRVPGPTPFNAASVALIEDAELAPYLPGPPLESMVVGFQATSISAKPQ